LRSIGRSLSRFRLAHQAGVNVDLGIVTINHQVFFGPKLRESAGKNM
jgi:hypothetical protein